MKLSKKKEKELMQVYEAYWAEYLNGNVDAMQALLDDSYTQIGSAAGEVFASKKEAVQFLGDTIDQVAGKLEMRNRTTKLESQDHLILIHEVCDLYALEDKKWIFYSKFRASTLLQEKKEGWKITHQHSSFPDTKTEAGQNLAIEKIAEENLKLREAVKRRTVELEHKNRELQIEAALERVRARAMGMQNSSELAELVDTVFKELTQLDFELGWCMINIIDAPSLSNTVWTINSETGKIPESFHMKFEDYPFHDAMMKGYKERATKYIYVLGRAEKKEYDEYLFNETEFRKVPQEALAASRAMEKYVCSFSFCNFGGLQTVGNEPLSDANMDILARFGKVFDLTYTRFNDLLKAEEQAREASIEVVLERVRSRTMGMQKSAELKEVVKVIFDQLSHLSINAEHTGIVVDYEPKKDWHFWVAETQDIPAKITVPYLDLVWDRQFTEAKKEGKHFFTTQLDFDEKNSFYKELLPHIEGLTNKARDFYFSCPGLAASTIIEKDIGLYIENFSGTPYTGKENDILKRFAKVFQQTYTRFLDLQKAEAQAREAQIETALERLRSRSMAMYKSEELADLSLELVKQVQNLGVATWFCAFNIYDNDPKGSLEWGSNGEGTFPKYRTPREGIFLRYYKAGQKGGTLLINEIEENECAAHYEYLCTLPGVGEQLLKMKDAGIPFPKSQIDHVAYFKYGYILFITYEPTPESHDVFKRFAKVFEQTYTRFLDLQKAEAQAREAQIEAALERVRGRALAMHKSEELLAVIEVVSEQLLLLDLNFDTVSFGKNNQEGDFKFWLTSSGQPKPVLIEVPFLDSRVLRSVIKAQKKGTDFIEDVFTREESKEWSEHLIKFSNLKLFPEHVKQFILNSPGFARSSFLMNQIDLYVGNYRATPFTAEENAVFKRFAQVFAQAYTRFLDLQRAEAQAKEAQIENALEKVRSRTMAMQNSYELPKAANDLFIQVQALGIPAWSAGYCIWETKDKKAASCNMSSEGEIQKSFILPTIGEGYNFYDPLQKGEIFYVEELGGDALVKHYDFMRTLPTVGKILDELIAAGLSLPTFQIFHIVYFPQGYLMFITYEQVPDAHEIFKRFAKVFEQTYTRFLDLQKAEAQAREATKQASLDRVRGQIASMRTAADLERITPLVWNELTTMEVPFIRCGVFIMHEPKEIVEVYLSAPDGHSLGVLHLQFNADPLTANTVAHWRKGNIFKEHWNRDEFLSWTQSLIEQGQISNIKTYQGAANPPESLNLHFIPFTQGMLYVGSENPLNVEQIELVQSLADAFAIAYARYEDFTKLEKAKESVETTLTELKATQNQLVQSEKMASLGELTAGIAHEIQNPLNFVNNFSEVSSELIEEMNEEIEKGDMEEAKAIATDVKQNLEKILHHGKRADGIVKGMLQHSRSSSGVKELTDINALADEYLRLAYHGLRAKDKSFNATMKTDFDKKIGKINIIHQDIGRVVLNLITNAFYTVNEKSSSAKASGDTKYEPTVSVSTKKVGKKVEIKVMDNGNGIPKKVLDKIFQPFFTTKPTGQGTGLGLSLSYDIVKTHGGELKVETNEGEGSQFIIILPV